MNVYTIGSDRNIFNEKTFAFKRMFAYASKLNNLSIIILSLKNSNLQEKHIGNLHLYPTNSISKVLYPFDIFKIFFKIFKKGYKDSLIVSQDPFELGFISLVLSKIFSLNLQIQIHTDFFNNNFKSSALGLLRFFLAKFVLNFYSRIRVVSSDIKFNLISYFKIKEDRIDVLPILIDKEKIENSKPVNLKEMFKGFNKFVLVASRLTEEKMVNKVIEAFKLVLTNNPKTLLLICGDGVLKKDLEKLSVDLGISKNIKFLGWREDIFSYMKSVDVFVSNSLYEGYGMSVVEAGFCKCPIVTTKTGIAKSIFKDLENCLFVSCLDISGISDKINMFLDDKLFSEKIINNTFNLLNDNYSFENYVEDYISLLKKCLS